MGVWPGLDERPEIAHAARDWLAKLHLVAAGLGVTTVPGSFTRVGAAGGARPAGPRRSARAAATPARPASAGAARAGGAAGRRAAGRRDRGRPGEVPGDRRVVSLPAAE